MRSLLSLRIIEPPVTAAERRVLVRLDRIIELLEDPPSPTHEEIRKKQWAEGVAHVRRVMGEYSPSRGGVV